MTFAALYPLQRLKARFPLAKGSSGHRLSISAFMPTSKLFCDNTYSSKSWCILDKACLHSGRSTSWNERCAPTWSSSSTSISRHCATFELASSLILLDLSTALDHSNPAIGPFHRLHPSPDAAAPVGDIRGALSPTTSEGSFPHGQGVLGASTIYFRIYTYFEDHL